MISRAATETTEQRVLSRFLKACIPHEIRPITEWAEAEVVVPSGPFEGYTFEADRLPYSRLLLSELGKWQRHAVNGPTQSGKSFHAFVLVVMYYLFERQEDVIVGVPDDNMSGIKWSEDIRPVIEQSSYANLLPKSGDGAKDGKRVQSVQFENGVTLTFMGGGGGDNQRAGATTRILAVTEANKFDVVATTSQEGQSKIRQLEARTKAYGDDALLFFECTNTTDNAFIWKEYQEGSCSRIVHQCRSCRGWVSPDREHLIGWQEAEDEFEVEENARFTCPECGVFYSEDDRIAMNRKAKLIHKGQEITPSGEIVGPRPRTKTLGFRWGAFENLLCSTAYIATEEWRAKRADNREAAEAAVSQQVFSRPVKDDTVERDELTVDMVCGVDKLYRARCNGLERGELPDSTNVVTSMIDLGKYKLAWSVNAHGSGWRHVPDYGFQATRNVETRGEEAAIETALRELITDLNSRYEINMGLVDCGHWGKVAKKVVSEFGPNWRCSMGDSQYHHPSKKTKDKKPSANGDRWYESKNADRVWVINFDPDAWKAKCHRQWMITPVNEDGEPHTGIVTLYGDDPRHHTEFAEQLTAEVFERRWKDGKGWIEGWWKKRRNNHLLDTDVGNLVAFSMCAGRRTPKQQSTATQTRLKPTLKAPKRPRLTPGGGA